jgi:aspartate dehydrogenase
MSRAVLEVTLVGFGAIGRSIFQRLGGSAHTRIAHIGVSPARVAALQAELGSAVQVTDQVPASSRLVLECAGHSALTQHVVPALAQGVEFAWKWLNGGQDRVFMMVTTHGSGFGANLMQILQGMPHHLHFTIDEKSNSPSTYFSFFQFSTPNFV